MSEELNIETLKPFEARTIIEALRKGAVPVDYVPFFTVGRSSWLKFIAEDLDDYIAEGGAKVRFINGDYGDGKTHFMSIIRHLSLQKDFAVSFVVLTREVPMNKFEVVYQDIVRQLTGRFEGTGIRALVETWVENQQEVLTSDGEALQEKIQAMGETLRALPGMDLNFVNALMGLLHLRYDAQEERDIEEEREAGRAVLYQWFEGARVSKRDLKPFQVFEPLSKANSKRFLGALIVFLRHIGYKGLILLLDELETVIAQGATIRNTAYENVRLLIDNTEQAQFLHIFFSIIPDVLLVEKGFRSYDALWSRIRSIGESKRLNYRNVLIDLHRTPLEKKELIALGVSLRQIHEISYRWEARELVQDDLIKQLCDTQEKMGVMSEVRLFVKQVIRMLDMAEQGEPPDDQTDLTEHIITSQREMEQEKLEQMQPDWDK